MFGFIETKRLKIVHLRTKIEISLSVIGVQFPGENKRKFVVNHFLQKCRSRCLGSLGKCDTSCDNFCCNKYFFLTYHRKRRRKALNCPLPSMAQPRYFLLFHSHRRFRFFVVELEIYKINNCFYTQVKKLKLTNNLSVRFRKID